MIKYGYRGLKLIKSKIYSKELKELGRNKPNHFTRERKMGFTNLIYYNLNKRGLCTNMEINNFFGKLDVNITLAEQSLLDQRLKLNPEVFIELNKSYLKPFYSEYKEDVKTYKGYLLKSIDGSDFEIPNTQKSKAAYGVAKNRTPETSARATVSISYDLLNHYIIDGTIEKYRTSEIKMALNHIQKDQEITTGYNSIYIMDRNYVSISFISQMIKDDIKFLARLKAQSHYIEETKNMKSNDEIVEIKHIKHRIQKSRFHSDEIYEYAKSKKSTRVRIVKYILKTGEIEYLITNIEDFSYEEISKLYEKRWGIETLYYSLKSKLQIQKFTSSNKIIIEQDFFCSILVYNMIQTMKNEAEEDIQQGQFKHEMKVNENMAIGLFKNEMIDIMLEEDEEIQSEKYEKLCEKILKYKIPIRKNREFDIKFKTDNQNSYNKLKSY